MGELITIEREEDRPRLICPHCKQQIYVDIDPWKKDVTKIMRDNCPKCRREIIIGLLILTDINMYRFLNSLKAIVNAAKEANQTLGKG
jgi:hypothetical protein